MAKVKINNSREFIDCDQLPENYGYTQVSLITRDPNWIYAYWDISTQSLSRLKKTLGDSFSNSTFILRMHDVTSSNNECHSFDIDVGDSARSWYINLLSDHVSYCCDLGVRFADGNFHALARSNVATTQRREWVNRFDAKWAEVQLGKNGEPAFVESTRSAKSLDEEQSDDALTANGLSQKTLPENVPLKLIGISKKKSRRRIPLTADEIIAYYARLMPRLRRIKPNLIARLKKKGLLAENIPSEIDFSDVEKELFFKHTFKSTQGIGASENFVGGASESLPGGASEISYRLWKFFFELGVELIVYGRTEPDATVYWGDKKIHLQPDGTFSMRFMLPDGNVPLNFVAQSVDKIEQRHITTVVERFHTTHTNQITA